MNKLFAIFAFTLLFITPSLAQIRNSNKIEHYNSLNESVKAILGSVLDHIDTIDISDSSDGGISDDSDDWDDLLALYDEPEEKIKGPTKIEDLFNDAFGPDNKFFEGLMEMVARSLENLHDHKNKFIDVSLNETKVNDTFKHDAIETFRNFQGLITNIIDNILDNDLKIDNDEYIVSDKDVNKPLIEENKVEKNETMETSGKEEIVEESKNKVKNGLKTISFIKERLSHKFRDHPNEKRPDPSRGNKTLRRQNALRPKDFEDFLKYLKEKEKGTLEDIDE